MIFRTIPLLIPTVLVAAFLFFTDATRTTVSQKNIYPHTIHGLGTVIQAERVYPRHFHIQGKPAYKHSVVIASQQQQQQYALSWYSTSQYPFVYPGTTISYTGTLYPLYPNANNSGFDYSRYLQRRAIHATIRTKKRNIHITNNHTNAIGSIESIRVAFQKKLFASLSPDQAGILSALLSGNRDTIPEDIQNAFRITGTAHLLAISGLHLALLIGILYWLLGWIFPYRRHRIPLIICCTIILMIFSGSNPPVIRAGIMILLLAGAFIVQRRLCLYNILCASFLITILLWPHHLFSPGMYLSYAAVIGIVLTIERWRPQHKITSFVAVSFGAWAWTAPLILFIFGSFQPWSPLCNLLIVPLFGIFLTVEIILVCGALLTHFSWIWSLIETLSRGFTSAITYLASLVPPPLYMPPPTPIILLLFFIGAFLFLKRYRGGLTIALMAIIIYIPWGCGYLCSTRNEVSFLHVGKGDSTIITINKKAIVIDCGGFKNATRNALLSRGFTTISYLILTHSDKDHILNALELLHSFNVTHLVLPQGCLQTKLIKKIQQQAKHTMCFKEGDHISLPPYNLSILNPHGYPQVTNENENEYSLALLLSKKNTPLIFMGGDIETNTKKRLLQKYKNRITHIPVMKVPHHGRNSFRDAFFIHTTHPHYAIINGFTDQRMQRYILQFNPSIIINTQFTGEKTFDLDKVY